MVDPVTASILTSAGTAAVEGIIGTPGSSVSQSGTSDTKTITKGTTTATGTQTTELEALLTELFQKQSEQLTEQQATGTSETESQQQVSSLSAESVTELQELISQLTTSLNTEIDTEALRDQAISEVLDQGMAEILGLGTRAGAYDDSATSSAAERLAARAVTQGTKVQVDADLAQQQQATALANTIGSLFGVEKGSQVLSTDATTGVTTNVGSEATTGSESGESTSEQLSTQDIAQESITDIFQKQTSHTETVQESEDSGGGLLGSIGL